jgi:hypothetical protein
MLPIDLAAWLSGIRDNSNSGAQAPVKVLKEKLSEHGSDLQFPWFSGRMCLPSTMQQG